MIYASKHCHASRSNFRFEPIHRLLRVKVAWDNDQSLCWHFRSRRLGCPPEHSPTNQDKDHKYYRCGLLSFHSSNHRERCGSIAEHVWFLSWRSRRKFAPEESNITIVAAYLVVHPTMDD